MDRRRSKAREYSPGKIEGVGFARDERVLASQVQPIRFDSRVYARVAAGTSTIEEFTFGRLVEYLSAFVLFVARCGSVEFKYRGFCIPARASFLATIFPGVCGTASYYL